MKKKKKEAEKKYQISVFIIIANIIFHRIFKNCACFNDKNKQINSSTPCAV
jgi:hypothetical protein